MTDEAEDDIKIPLIKKEKDENEKKSNKEKSEDNNNEEESEEDEEDNKISQEELNEIIRKNKIISKVYLVFFVQSLIIFLFIYFAFYEEIFTSMLKKNGKLFYLSAALAFVIMLISFKVKILTVVPLNYFFFLLFSACISVIICKISILFTFKTIGTLWTLFIVMILSLAIYTYNLKKEIKLISAAFIVFLILFCASIVLKFSMGVSILNMILINICLVTVGLYLIYDTKYIIEEKGLKKNDYFTLNILVYFDIIMNFIKLVKFIYNNLQSEEKSQTLESIKGIMDDLEKSFKEVKNLGKSDDEEEDDDDDDKKKKKGKNDKKGKKDDKKDDKKGKGKKKDKKEEKKEDKKDKGKKKDKKSDKKNDKKKKKKKDDEDNDGEKIFKDFFGNIFK